MLQNCWPEKRAKAPLLRQRGHHAVYCTLSIAQHWLAIADEREFLRLVQNNFLPLFPRLVSQGQFNRRARNLCWLINTMRQHLVQKMGITEAPCQLIDGTPVHLRHWRRFGKGHLLLPEAALGYCASKKETYYGFRLLALTTLDGNIQAAVDTAVWEYRNLADFAAFHGVEIALEPLNAAIMNIESAIWTLPQAMQIVEAVDRDNFGICLDCWNVWQNAGLFDAIEACGNRIFVVQVSDWRTPRSFQDRLIPGQGEIPLADFLRAVRETGYKGAYSVEIFSKDVPDALWDGNLEQVIRDSRAGARMPGRQRFPARLTIIFTIFHNVLYDNKLCIQSCSVTS